MTTYTKHIHKFTRSKPSATVECCQCGKWRHTEHAGPAIVEQHTTHTPGPWRCEGEEALIIGDNHLCHSVIRSDTERWTALVEVEDNEGLANARLIAAAPELLEALKEVRDIAYNHGSIDGIEPSLDAQKRIEILHKCWEAIAKAEGR